MRAPLLTIITAAFLTIAACSSADPTASPATVEPEAGVDASPPPPDAGPPPPPAPARPEGRRLTKLPGPVLAKPVVVPLFWGNDADRARTETLLGALPGSDYWKLVGEYGVGDLVIAPSVSLGATAPTSFSLNDVESVIGAFTDGTQGPKADGTQIYTLFLPSQTSVLNTDGSPFCQAGGGYHQSTVGHVVDFAYAVVPHCSSAFDDYAVTLTHELIEAATDPYPLTTPAWAGTDPGHVGFRGEVGDLCDYGGALGNSGIGMFGTRIERVFSNKQAAKGGDPCLPELGLTYFDAAPVPTDDVVVEDWILGKVKGRGVRVAVGKTKTVQVLLYADRTLPAWKVMARPIANATQQPSNSITATLDRATGGAGDVLTLTIERTSAADPAGDSVWLYSSNGKAIWTDTINVGE